jgi:hypothetical protein
VRAAVRSDHGQGRSRTQCTMRARGGGFGRWSRKISFLANGNAALVTSASTARLGSRWPLALNRSALIRSRCRTFSSRAIRKPPDTGGWSAPVNARMQLPNQAKRRRIGLADSRHCGEKSAAFVESLRTGNHRSPNPSSGDHEGALSRFALKPRPSHTNPLLISTTIRLNQKSGWL